MWYVHTGLSLLAMCILQLVYRWQMLCAAISSCLLRKAIFMSTCQGTFVKPEHEVEYYMNRDHMAQRKIRMTWSLITQPHFAIHNTCCVVFTTYFCCSFKAFRYFLKMYHESQIYTESTFPSSFCCPSVLCFCPGLSDFCCTCTLSDVISFYIWTIHLHNAPSSTEFAFKQAAALI